MQVPWQARFVLALLLALAVLATSISIASADAQTDAIDAGIALSRHRNAVGLTDTIGFAAESARAHASYLKVNAGRAERAGLRVHEEDPSLPGYTPDGDATARRSHVTESHPRASLAVDALIDAPLHRHGMLDPRLDRIGVGQAGSGTLDDPSTWVIDLGARNTPWEGAPVAITYPGDGQSAVPLRFADGEQPDPRMAVIAAFSATSPMTVPNVGYPITLHFFGCSPTLVEARLTDIGGLAPDRSGTRVVRPELDVPIFTLAPGTVMRTPTGDRSVEMILFFAKQPLLPETVYRATVVATCAGMGTSTSAWTFSTRARLRPRDVRVALAPPDPAGWQVGTITVDPASGTVPAYHLSRIEAQFRFDNVRTGSVPPPSGAPEMQILDEISRADGTLRFRIRLRGAQQADATLTIDDDGTAVLVPVVITP